MFRILLSSEKVIDRTSEDDVKKEFEDKTDLMDRVFETIVSSGENGIIQTDVCREFSLHSRDGSRLLTSMEKRSMIVREKVLYKGRWTFKIIANKSKPVEAQKPVEIACVNGAPCLYCTYQNLCSDDDSSKYSPITCSWLEEWLITDFDKNVINVSIDGTVKSIEQKDATTTAAAEIRE